MLFKNIEKNYLNAIYRFLRGSVIVQIVQLIGTFTLTYFFEKQDFGALSFLLSVSFIFEMVAGLQYNNAAVVSNVRRNVPKLMLISMISAMGISMVVLAAIAFSKFFVPDFYARVYLGGLVIALPFLLISNYIFNNSLLILRYYGKIRNINFYRTLYVLLTLTGKLVGALIFGTVESLVYGHLVGILITCLLITFNFRAEIESTFRQLTFQESLLLIRDNYRFPKYSIFSSVVNAATNMSFPILITLFFGLHENGIYYLTTVFIFQPLSLILQAVSDAFLPKVSGLFYESKIELFKFIKQQQKVILRIVIIYFLAVVLAGEFLFPYFLPQQWIEIGKFIKFQLLFFLFASLYSPFSIIGDYLKKQRFLMFFNLSLFAFQFFSLFFLHTHFDFTFVILIASIVSALHYAFINFYMLENLKLSS